MFLVDRRSARADIRSQSELEPAVGRLAASGWRPLIRHLAAAAAAAAELPEGIVTRSQMVSTDSVLRRRGLPPSPLGELFFKGGCALLLQPFRGELFAWEIRRHDVEPHIDPFCANVADAIRASVDGRRVRGMDFTWRQLKPVVRGPASPAYGIVQLQTKTPDATPEESRRSSALANSDLRNALRRLAQLGKARSVDATFQANDSVRTTLVSEGLIQIEFLVLCKQDSHTICTVRDREVLDVSPTSDLHCSVCNRAFRDEQVQEIVAVTDCGRALLDGSRWMTCWVTELLSSAGLSQDNVKWNAAAGSDEVDIVAEVSQLRVFFELKDREFGLGDAYPFAARVARYGADYGVVVSADKIAEDARRFLQEQRRTFGAPPFELVSGEQSIAAQITGVLDRISQAAVRFHLMQLEAPIAATVLPVLETWMRRFRISG